MLKNTAAQPCSGIARLSAFICSILPVLNICRNLSPSVTVASQGSSGKTHVSLCPRGHTRNTMGEIFFDCASCQNQYLINKFIMLSGKLSKNIFSKRFTQLASNISTSVALVVISAKMVSEFFYWRHPCNEDRFFATYFIFRVWPALPSPNIRKDSPYGCSFPSSFVV